MKSKFDDGSPLGEALKGWWNDLQSRNGDRAELKRAQTITEVMLIPAFQHACIRFKPFFQHQDNWEPRLAAIIGLLAHVRTLSTESLALAMAGKPKPVVSELRFRRLIQRNREELYVVMIRVLRLLGNKANVCDLASSVYYWGDRVKRDWAFEYFPNTSEKVSP